MNARPLLAVSLALNLAAAVALAVILRNRPESATAAAAAPARVAITNAAPVRPVESSAPRRREVPGDTPDAAAIPRIWNRVEVADYKQYAANLRALGMPEQMVRDIIELDLMRSLGEQFAELVGQASPPFWQGNSARWRSKVGTADVARAVAEFRQISRDTLGVEPAEWLWDHVNWMVRAETELRGGFAEEYSFSEPLGELFGFAEHADGYEWLPRQRLDGLMRLRETFAAREAAIESRRTDTNGEAIDAEIARLSAEREKAEAAYLTPAERHEAELRGNRDLIAALAAVDLSRAEFERLSALDLDANAPGAWRADGTPQQAQALALLGQDRYREAVRGYDEDYLTYLRACHRANLDLGVAAGLYDIKQQFVRATEGLSAAEAEPVRMQAVAAVRDLVGTNAFSEVIDWVSPTLRPVKPPSPPGVFEITIDQEQTVDDVATMYGVTPEELRALNKDLPPQGMIPVGKSVNLPLPTP